MLRYMYKTMFVQVGEEEQVGKVERTAALGKLIIIKYLLITFVIHGRLHYAHTMKC